MIFHVTREQAEDGWTLAECPALPRCVSQGRDEKEALENIREAITTWMSCQATVTLKLLQDFSGPPLPIVRFHHPLQPLRQRR
jgi:predicted RNase H-like HicB family nuclease